MRIRNLLSAAALSVAALGLTGCATGLNTKVTRFQPASIPAGYSFYVIPAEGPDNAQFRRFATQVAAQLEAKGFKPAGAPQLADMLVRVDYSVDEGRVERREDPFYTTPMGMGWGGGWGYRDPFFDPYFGVYYGRPYYSRYSRSPYYWGWNDPFWSYGMGYGGYGRGYGPYGRYGYDSYTVYKSQLDMDIVQRASNAPLFEGHAQARSATDDINELVPNLIEAMFTGFPGRNGETVRITVPPKRKG